MIAASGCRVAALAALTMGALAVVSGARGQTAPPAKDTIFARKILMGAISMNMDEIESMLAPGGTLEAAEAKEHADTISIMLMSFPHLFPPPTNQWRAGADRDPATDTFASPDLWNDFADFYQRATSASKLAQEASQTRRLDEFKSLIGQLRAACDGCHAKYMKPD